MNFQDKLILSEITKEKTSYIFTQYRQQYDILLVIIVKMQQQKDIRVQKIIKSIVIHKDFPKVGRKFLDVFPIVAGEDTLNDLMQIFTEKIQNVEFDKIFMIETRGFILGVPLSVKTGKPCFPICKKGKLPGKVITQSYELSYGIDTLEIQKYKNLNKRNSINSGDKVIIIDDIVATGGTLMAAIKLLLNQGAIIAHILSICQIPQLNPRKNMGQYGSRLSTVFQFKA